MKKFNFTLTTQPRLCPMRCPECTCKLELVGDPTLYELAICLNEAIEFQFDHPFGFYSNLENAYGTCEEKYTLFADMGESEDGEPGVQSTKVVDVFSEGKTMLFLFDYGDDWHFHVTCDKVAKSRAKEGWRLLSVQGDLPEQYPDFE